MEQNKFSKVFVSICGASGSGKSSMAQYLRYLVGIDPYQEMVICEADDYFYEKYGEYKWKAEELGAAHNSCREKFQNAINNDISLVVVSNTGCVSKDRNYYIDKAKEKGYTIFSIVLENLGTTSVHNVPEETLIKQAAQLKNSIKLR